MRFCTPALIVTAVVALAAPAVAHADARDDDFVNNLAGQGITGDPGKLVSTAHTVCTTSTQANAAVPGGLGQMMPMGYVLTSLHLNVGQIGPFIDTAKATYCPPPAPPAAPAPAPGAEPAADAPAAPPPPPPPPAPAVPAMAGMPGLPGMPGMAGIAGIPGMDRLSSALGAMS